MDFGFLNIDLKSFDVNQTRTDSAALIKEQTANNIDTKIVDKTCSTCGISKRTLIADETSGTGFVETSPEFPKTGNTFTGIEGPITDFTAVSPEPASSFPIPANLEQKSILPLIISGAALWLFLS